jgi:hypothetical protein
MELDNYIRGVTSSPEIKQLVEARLKAQAKFKPAKKSGRNEFNRFDYSTYADLVDATLPALVENGFGLPSFQTGLHASGEWVMVGKLMHKSGEWISCMSPLRDQIEKTGAVRMDNHSFESAITYAQKNLMRCLLGIWSVGAEEAEQQTEMESQVNQESAPKVEPKAKPGELFNKIVGRMKTVRTLPAELEKCFRDAESLAESGDLTADEMSRLTRQFGALRPKEVASANG